MRGITRAVIAAALLAVPPACGLAPAPVGAPAATGASAAGHLLIVGGGRQPTELVSRFVDLAGGPGRARIAVIPLASGVPESSGQGKVDQLVGMGAEAFVLNPTREQAASESVARVVDDVSGIWFTGGDQIRVTRVLAGTPLLAAIERRYRAGAVIAGTSAGAAIMSDSMLTGEQVLEGEDTIGYHGDEYRRIARGAIRVVPGLGFVSGAIVDQHFIERERHNRLLSVVLERPTLIGVGIAESTAIQVNPDRSWEVIGDGSVVIYDARAAEMSGPEGPLGTAGLRMHLLPAGSSFDPARGTARLPGG